MAGEYVTPKMLYDVVTQLQGNIENGTERRFNALRDDMRAMMRELAHRMDEHQAKDEAIATRVQIIETERRKESEQRIELAQTVQRQAAARGTLYGLAGGVVIPLMKMIFDAVKH